MRLPGSQVSHCMLDLCKNLKPTGIHSCLLIKFKDYPCASLWSMTGIGKRSNGLDFHRLRFVSAEFGSAINRIVDKSQSEIPGNPLSQTSGNLSVQYPWPSASLAQRRDEKCHDSDHKHLDCAVLQAAFSSDSHCLTDKTFSLVTLVSNNMGGEHEKWCLLCAEFVWAGALMKESLVCWSALCVWRRSQVEVQRCDLLMSKSLIYSYRIYRCPITGFQHWFGFFCRSR